MVPVVANSGMTAALLSTAAVAGNVLGESGESTRGRPAEPKTIASSSVPPAEDRTSVATISGVGNSEYDGAGGPELRAFQMGTPMANPVVAPPAPIPNGQVQEQLGHLESRLNSTLLHVMETTLIHLEGRFNATVARLDEQVGELGQAFEKIALEQTMLKSAQGQLASRVAQGAPPLQDESTQRLDEALGSSVLAEVGQLRQQCAEIEESIDRRVFLSIRQLRQQLGETSEKVDQLYAGRDVLSSPSDKQRPVQPHVAAESNPNETVDRVNVLLADFKTDLLGEFRNRAVEFEKRVGEISEQTNWCTKTVESQEEQVTDLGRLCVCVGNRLTDMESQMCSLDGRLHRIADTRQVSLEQAADASPKSPQVQASAVLSPTFNAQSSTFSPTQDISFGPSSPAGPRSPASPTIKAARSFFQAKEAEAIQSLSTKPFEKPGDRFAKVVEEAWVARPVDGPADDGTKQASRTSDANDAANPGHKIRFTRRAAPGIRNAWSRIIGGGIGGQNDDQLVNTSVSP